MHTPVYRVKRGARWQTWLLRCTRLSSLLAAASLIGGCLTSIGASPPSPSSTQGRGADGWETLSPGLERRTYAPSSDNLLLQLTALRIDPAVFRFRVHYQPGSALSIERWQAALPDAVAFINTNYFTPEQTILGLLIADGIVHGRSYTDRGGTFYVENDLPGVRSNLVTPYTGEPFEQAAQAFPMLVVDGQPGYTNPNDQDVSRRSVVAQDTQGRIVLLATNLLGIRLNELSSFLASSDMTLVNAVNLDGGGSTLFYIGAGSQPFYLRSFDPVPAVLAVYAR